MGNACAVDCIVLSTAGEPEQHMDALNEKAPSYADNCVVIYSPRKSTPTLCQGLSNTSPALGGFMLYAEKPKIANVDPDPPFSSTYGVAEALPTDLPRLRLGKHMGSPSVGATPEDTTPTVKGDQSLFKDAEPMPEPIPEPVVSAPEEESPTILEMMFDDNGEERRVQILKRPLGAEFSKRKSGPTKVSNVDPQSYAEELGLEVGWVIKSIAGEDMDGKTFQETQEAIKHGLMALPERPDK